MSGNKKTTTTSRFRPAGFIQQGAQQAASLASQYASQPFRAFQRERVAPLSANEQQALNLAGTTAGDSTATLDQAGLDFREADMQSYMNPFIRGALDPAAREIREDAARRREELAGSLASRGAFSGSRAVLADAELDRGTSEALGDLYGRGYAEAFDRGAALWQADQERAMRAAGLRSDLLDADTRRLMETGQTQRMVDQMERDFDYQQFVEGREYSGRQAAFLTDVLRGLQGSYETTQTDTRKDQTSRLGQVLGAAVSLGAAYFTGGGSLGGLAGLIGRRGGGALSDAGEAALAAGVS